MPSTKTGEDATRTGSPAVTGCASTMIFSNGEP
ncbi:hypothetical protein A2U01_0115197, partial [Trifolium medium]|nr:hypothetical protein [Trifolium medium]